MLFRKYKDGTQYLYAVIHIIYIWLTSHTAEGHIWQLLLHNYYVIPLLVKIKCKVQPTTGHEDPDEV